MDYEGRLYGRLQGRFFDTGMTTVEFDNAIKAANSLIKKPFLITMDGELPFVTHYYCYDDNWIEEVNMKVYNMIEKTWTDDGRNWKLICEI